MLKRSFLALAALVFAGAVASAAFAQPRPLTAGKDYLELSPPQPTEAGDKNEVIEFFWYRCPHCYSLEPYLESWVKKLPQDTRFRRVPAVFSEEWAIDARIFFALEALGQEERVHRGLFDAIHKEGGVNLRGDAYAKWVAGWLAKRGVDMAKYDAALHSFSVDSQTKRAAQSAQAYKLDGVPAIAINGRYLVSAGMHGDRQGMIDAADQMLAQARKRGVAKK
jgi:protein dithiol oxidoreductase (disulfide-forming)